MEIAATITEEVFDDRALLSAVLDDVPDAIVLTDERHKVVLANPAARSVFGYEPDDLVGKPLAFLYESERELDRLDPPQHARSSHSSSGVKVLSYRRQDGAVFPGETVTTQVRRDAWSTVGWLLMIRDVSKRSLRQSEEARARQRLEDALEALNEGFSLWDRDGRLVTSNSRYRELFPRSAHLLTPGVRFEAVLRHAVEHRDSHVPVERREQWIQERLERHRNPPGEPFTQRREDGRWILVAEHTTRDGSIAGIRMDITAQKRTELALHRLASIIATRDVNLDGKFEQILRLGTDHLGLRYGMISAAQGDTFQLRNAVSPELELVPGTRYPAEGSFCARTLSEGQHVRVGAQGVAEVLLFQGIAVRAYAGVTWQVNGEPAGTVCFFSDQPREEPFASSDMELLRLFGQWIGHEVERGQTLEELREARRELERLATTDDLTGLRNRRSLLAFGRDEFRRARRFGHGLCVLALDVDHFKRINDSVGHAGGDRVLRRVAACCRESVRGPDGVGRIGGEEFVLVLVEASAGVAEEIGERVRLSVAGLESGAGIPVTMSVGVAELNGDDTDFESLLARADAALYLAKKGGRNRVCLAPA